MTGYLAQNPKHQDTEEEKRGWRFCREEEKNIWQDYTELDTAAKAVV